MNTLDTIFFIIGNNLVITLNEIGVIYALLIPLTLIIMGVYTIIIIYLLFYIIKKLLNILEKERRRRR